MEINLPMYDGPGGMIEQSKFSGKRFGHSGEITQEGRAALLEVARDEIRRLVNGEQFDVRQLTSIGFLAENMRSMLADLTVQLSEEAKQVEQSLLPVQAGPSGEYPQNATIASTAHAETFGALMLRELIPALTGRLGQPKARSPSLGELVEAAEAAKSAGNERLHGRILRAIERKIEGEGQDAETATAAPEPGQSPTNGKGKSHEVVRA